MAHSGLGYEVTGSKLLAVSISQLAVGVILVSLRTYTTLRITKAPRWDLWCTIIATILAIIAQPFVALAVQYGSGKDIGSVSPTDLEHVLLWQNISFTPIMLSSVFSKAATGILILQIQDRTVKHRKWMIYVILFANTVITLLLAIALWFQCTPLSDLWKTLPAINPSCSFAHVVNSMAIVQGSIGAFTDFFLALYPAIIFWQLQMSLKRRLGLCVLFVGGCFAGASSVIRITHTTAGLTDPNVTKAVAELLLWWDTETWLIIWVATIPPLQPLFGRGLRTVTAHTRTLSHRRSTALDGSRTSTKGYYDKDSFHLRDLESGSPLPRLPPGSRPPRRNSGRLGGAVRGSVSGGSMAGLEKRGVGQSLIEEVDSSEELILQERPRTATETEFVGGDLPEPAHRGIAIQTDFEVRYSPARL